jgi:holo-[acyl-carrier protein] synthase
MISGIGIDMIEVDRVAEKINKEQGFREMVFSGGEIAYCEAKTHKYEHYAARFAAKEAFMKAAGTGWVSELRFNEIEVMNDSNGKPHIVLSGNTLAAFNMSVVNQIVVSLTHLRGIASAVVYIESIR